MKPATQNTGDALGPIRDLPTQPVYTPLEAHLLAAFRELVAAAEADGWDIHNPATLAKARADLAKAEARS